MTQPRPTPDTAAHPAPTTSARPELPRDDRELVISRLFDAPRDLVFEAYTNVDAKSQWWGPHGFTTTTHAADVRPGGEWRFTMHGPDGTDFPNRIVFREIAAPERLVYDHDDDGEARGVEVRTRFVAEIDFEERGNQTLLTLRQRWPSAEVLAKKEATFGALAGGQQTLQRLAHHLARIAPDRVAPPRRVTTVAFASDRELVVMRPFAARPQELFDAFVTPEAFARWWRPNGVENVACELDPRPGGAWSLVQRGADGVEHLLSGEYREVVPAERLVMTWRVAEAGRDGEARRDGEAGRDHEGLRLSVTFTKVAGETVLSIRTLHPDRASLEHYWRHGQPHGTEQALERLAEVLGEG
ncbi:MAG: SRPBCC domain-containing protein [Trueperaceae bacterium]